METKTGPKPKGKPVADNGGYTGQQKTQINMEKLATLCQIQCTDSEIAAFFNVDRKTITRHKQDPKFREVMENNRQIGKISLRRALHMRGIDKTQSPALLIFACKNILDMSDKISSEITGRDGGPIEVTSVRETLDKRLAAISDRMSGKKKELAGAKPIALLPKAQAT